MSFCTEIEGLLTSISNLTSGSMPDSPVNAVCIYRTGGGAREFTESKLENPTFQVMIRNSSFDTGEALCNTIADLLHGKKTTNNLIIKQMSGPFSLPRDSNNNSLFSINFETLYRR